MKIYTRKGDKGFTSLFGGERVSKGHNRIEAYGLIDELGVHIAKLTLCPILSSEQKDLLSRVQNALFGCGSYLAKAFSDEDFESSNDSDLTDDLEVEIDRMQVILPSLKNFILPGGDPFAIQAHFCRVSTRHVERMVSRLNEEEYMSEKLIPFLNRLSDYFFVLARYINIKCDIEEVLWQP